MATTRHRGATEGRLEIPAGGWAFRKPSARSGHGPVTTAGLEQDEYANGSRAFERGSDAALLERIRTLRTILPAMATEVAIARREGARLRRENATLRARLAATEGPSAGATQIPSPSEAAHRESR
jgi:hypothetical protein